jgi:hypothetical protein
MQQHVEYSIHVPMEYTTEDPTIFVYKFSSQISSPINSNVFVHFASSQVSSNQDNKASN